MDDFSGSVMVALLPIGDSWCRIDLPHLTLVYAGEKKDLPPTAFNELAKDASMLAALTRPITLFVTGVEVFGDEDKVDVLRFRPSTELLAMRHALEGWNKSEYPFRPHATMGPIGTRTTVPMIPEQLTFDRIMVGWGEECLTFWLKMRGM